MKVGLTAFNEEKWPSVIRTYKFYERALSDAFDIEIIETHQIIERSKHLDVLVNFQGSLAWEKRASIECPILFGMHGGLIVDRPFIEKNLSQIQKRDRFLINCLSDRTILKNYHSNFSNQSELIHLPVESNITPSKAACRKILDINDNTALLGFVARLLPSKNLHGFLRILKRVKEELTPRPVRAVIIGNYWIDYPILDFSTKNYPEIIQKQISSLGLEKNIMYFPGVLSDEHLRLAYRAMDTLVHPTYGIDENFGYVPVEAMSMGTPVVGTAYGGLKETVIDKSTGRLMSTWVTSGGIRMDTETGISAIVEILNHKHIHQKMSKNARKHVLTFYSENICRAKLVRAVENAFCTNTKEISTTEIRASVNDLSSNKKKILPVVKRNWNEFSRQVRHYVSSDLPKMETGDKLFLPAPMEELKNGYISLNDPAWPINDKLDGKYLKILKSIPLGGYKLVSKKWPPQPEAEHLLADGWLSIQKSENFNA